MKPKFDAIRIDIVIFFILLTILTLFLIYQRNVRERGYLDLWKERQQDEIRAARAIRDRLAGIWFDRFSREIDWNDLLARLAVEPPEERGPLLEQAVRKGRDAGVIISVRDLYPHFHAVGINTSDPPLSVSVDFQKAPAGGSPTEDRITLRSSVARTVDRLTFALEQIDAGGEMAVSISHAEIRERISEWHPGVQYRIYTFTERGSPLVPQGITPSASAVIGDAVLAEIHRKIRSDVEPFVNAGQPFAASAPVGGVDYLAVAVPLDAQKPFEGAWLVSYRPDRLISDFRRGFIYTYGLSAALLAMMLALHFLYLRRFLLEKRQIERVNRERAGEIERLKASERALIAHEKQLQAVCDASIDALVMADTEGRIHLWNPAAERLFGFTGAEMIGKRFHQHIAPPEFRKQAEEALRRFREAGPASHEKLFTEITATRKDGSLFPVEMVISGIWLNDGWWSVAAIRDISHRKRIEHQLRELSTNDELTNLPIHDHFMRVAAREFDRARRYRRPLSLVLLDIDDFERIGAEYGAKTADLVLKTMAVIIQNNVRLTDIVARMEEGQLALLLSETGFEMAEFVGRRLQKIAANTLIPLGNGTKSNSSIRFNVGIGAAEVTDDLQDINGLIQEAQRSLEPARGRQPGRQPSAV